MGGGQSQDKDAGTPDKAAKTAEAGEKPPEKAAAKAKSPDKVPLDPHAMAARIEAAERQNRRLRRRSWVVGLLSVLALVVGAAALLAPYNTRVRWALDRVIRRANVVVPQRATIEGERLVVRGSDGQIRAELAQRADGALALGLYDLQGNLRAELSVGEDGLGALTLAGTGGQPGLAITPKSVRVADAEGAAFLASTSLGLTAWEVGDARSGVWVGTRPDGTSSLTLSDRQGKTRAGIALKADGAPTMTLNDREGRTGAVLDVPADGARLGLFSDGVPRAAMGYGAGGPQIGLYGNDGKERAAMRHLPDGSTGVFLADGEGRERIAMGIRPSGATGLSLFDRKGTLRTAMSTVADDSPNLVLFDAGGVRRASIGLGSDGSPGIRFEDKGRARMSLSATAGERAGAPGPPAFVLYDKDGTILFQAPVY